MDFFLGPIPITLTCFQDVCAFIFLIVAVPLVWWGIIAAVRDEIKQKGGFGAWLFGAIGEFLDVFSPILMFLWAILVFIIFAVLCGVFLKIVMAIIGY
jgi:hypothetical protein